MFIEQANQYHPSIKFTAEISENNITFLDTIIYKRDRLLTDSILDIKTHYKPTETFQYTHLTSCHSLGVKRGFIKGEATRLLRTNSSQTTFEECLPNLKLRLKARGYPNNFIERSLTGVRFQDRRLALQQRKKTQTKILPLCQDISPGSTWPKGNFIEYVGFNTKPAVTVKHLY